MTNPFSGLLNQQFKDTFTDAIDALLASFSLPCIFHYPAQNTACPNCFIDPIGKRSANKYKPSGPVSFPDNTVCPVCAGLGLLSNNSTETINLAIIWDYRKWIKIGVNIEDPAGYIQTISSNSIIANIVGASEIIVDTNVQLAQRNRFQLAGMPVQAGLGQDTYLICMWKRIQ